LVVLNALPKSALAPLFIVWIGTGTKTIIVAGISVAIFGSIINLYSSFKETDAEKIYVELSPYCENGTYFDKYGNRREQKAVFDFDVSFAQLINNMLNEKVENITNEAEKSVNAISTGKVSNEEIINASKLF
jgi:hypothetical protein